ncbi:MAG: hypothetical protein Q6351_003025 [Candidatus Njordarchaeum guaymaensis]
MSSKIILPPLHTLPEIDFKTKKEVWNIYLLEDDSLLLFKIVAVKFFKINDKDPVTGFPNFLLVHTNIASIRSKIRKEPKIPPFNVNRLADIPSNLRKEVKIRKIINEDWNSYILDGGFIYEVKPIMTMVFRVEGFFDRFGYPIYNVVSQNVSRTKKEV